MSLVLIFFFFVRYDKFIVTLHFVSVCVCVPRFDTEILELYVLEYKMNTCTIDIVIIYLMSFAWLGLVLPGKFH